MELGLIPTWGCSYLIEAWLITQRTEYFRERSFVVIDAGVFYLRILNA